MNTAFMSHSLLQESVAQQHWPIFAVRMLCKNTFSIHVLRAEWKVQRKVEMEILPFQGKRQIIMFFPSTDLQFVPYIQ